MENKFLKITGKITELARKHREEEDDEFSFYYEIEAYELIIKYLVDNNINIGDYDLLGLLNNDEEFEDSRNEIMYDIQFEVLMDNPKFELKPEVLFLYQFHKDAFWPE